MKHINGKRRGAVEARRAHNPDVPGSKPGGAIFLIFAKLSLLLAIKGGYCMIYATHESKQIHKLKNILTNITHYHNLLKTFFIIS